MNKKDLIQFIKEANLDKLKLYLSGKDKRDNDLLFLAISYDFRGSHINIVSYFLGLGFPINFKSSTGNLSGFENYLHGAIEDYSDFNRDAESPKEFTDMSMIKFLIEKGVDVNHKNNLNMTPLDMAYAYGEVEVVKLLLDNGAKANEVDIHEIQKFVR